MVVAAVVMMAMALMMRGSQVLGLFWER